jgi:hypothetical protein
MIRIQILFSQLLCQNVKAATMALFFENQKNRNHYKYKGKQVIPTRLFGFENKCYDTHKHQQRNGFLNGF